MKYKNRLLRLKARQAAYDAMKNKQGFTRPGSKNK